MQNNCANPAEEYSYAGFWVRLAAFIIDSVIVFAALLVVRMFFGLVSIIFSEFSDAGTLFFNRALLFHFSLKDIVLYLVKVAYFVILTYYTGCTFGKRALNLVVISKKTPDGRLGLLDTIYRETIGRYLSGFILCLGYFMIGIGKEKCGLHDLLCDTRVVYGKKIKMFGTANTAPQSTPMPAPNAFNNYRPGASGPTPTPVTPPMPEVNPAMPGAPSMPGVNPAAPGERPAPEAYSAPGANSVPWTNAAPDSPSMPGQNSRFGANPTDSHNRGAGNLPPFANYGAPAGSYSYVARPSNPEREKEHFNDTAPNRPNQPTCGSRPYKYGVKPKNEPYESNSSPEHRDAEYNEASDTADAANTASAAHTTDELE